MLHRLRLPGVAVRRRDALRVPRTDNGPPCEGAVRKAMCCPPDCLRFHFHERVPCALSCLVVLPRPAKGALSTYKASPVAVVLVCRCDPSSGVPAGLVSERHHYPSEGQSVIAGKVQVTLSGSEVERASLPPRSVIDGDCALKVANATSEAVEVLTDDAVDDPRF